MVGEFKVVLNKEKSDRVAEVPRVELSVAHDVVHRAVLDSTWIPHLRYNSACSTQDSFLELQT